MKSGQFYRGKIDGIQKHFESPDLDKILPSEKLCELADYSEIGNYPRYFRQERVLAKTVISPAENTDGRPGGIINHTVIYQIDRDTTHETFPYVFDEETFIEELRAGKRRFKMPPAPNLPETDSNLIEPPSPLEWEVQTQNAT